MNERTGTYYTRDHSFSNILYGWFHAGNAQKLAVILRSHSNPSTVVSKLSSKNKPCVEATDILSFKQGTP